MTFCRSYNIAVIKLYSWLKPDSSGWSNMLKFGRAKLSSGAFAASYTGLCRTSRIGTRKKVDQKNQKIKRLSGYGSTFMVAGKTAQPTDPLWIYGSHKWVFPAKCAVILNGRSSSPRCCSRFNFLPRVGMVLSSCHSWLRATKPIQLFRPSQQCFTHGFKRFSRQNFALVWLLLKRQLSAEPSERFARNPGFTMV